MSSPEFSDTSSESQHASSRRLSYREIEDANWPALGLEAGSTQLQPGIYDFQPLAGEAGDLLAAYRADQALEGEYEPSLSTIHLDVADGFEFYGLQDELDIKTMDSLHAIESRAKLLTGVSALLAEQDTNAITADAREAFVKTVLADFRDKHPDAVLDSSLAKSYDGLEQFMQHYAVAVREQLGVDPWIQTINGFRAELATTVDSPRFRQLLRAPARQRIIDASQRMPIIIQDPISSIMFGKNFELEGMHGSFLRESRTIQLDLVAIQKTARSISSLFHSEYGASPELQEWLLKTNVKRTVFHEMIHAVSSYHDTEDSYTSTSMLGDPELATHRQTYQLWNAYWNEAFTEKVAFRLFASTVIGTPEYDALKDRTGNPSEARYRATMSHKPHEVFLAKDDDKLRRLVSSAYVERRLLIDSMFEQLDWQAAGISRTAADRLAVRAFTELPGDEKPESRKTDRQAFIEAVNAAAHPGFLMKFNGLVEMMGEELVMDVMSDKHFDAHNPQHLPAIGGVRQFWFFNSDRTERQLFSQRIRLARMRGLLGDSDFNPLLEDIAELQAGVAELEATLAERDAYKTAVGGLRTILERRHPQRVQQSDAELRLLDSIFGKSAGLKMITKTRDPEQSDEAANAAIESWITHNAAKRNGV